MTTKTTVSLDLVNGKMEDVKVGSSSDITPLFAQ